MPGPITSISNGDVYWSDPPAERELHDRIVEDLDQRPSGPCGSPRSVIDGVLCGDDTAVSTACRRAQPGSVDEYLCDDRKLKAAQDWVGETTWDMLKRILSAALLRTVK
jgi:hypothetical protein